MPRRAGSYQQLRYHVGLHVSDEIKKSYKFLTSDWFIRIPPERSPADLVLVEQLTITEGKLQLQLKQQFTLRYFWHLNHQHSN